MSKPPRRKPPVRLSPASAAMWGTYERLGLHTGATRRQVIWAASARCDKRVRAGQPEGRAKREARHKFYRHMLACHAYWQDLARYR